MKTRSEPLTKAGPVRIRRADGSSVMLAPITRASQRALRRIAARQPEERTTLVAGMRCGICGHQARDVRPLAPRSPILVAVCTTHLHPRKASENTPPSKASQRALPGRATQATVPSEAPQQAPAAGTYRRDGHTADPVGTLAGPGATTAPAREET